MNLKTIREWQFNQMEWTVKSIEAILHRMPAEDLTRYRDGGDGWTVVEVLGHLRDFERVFLQRAQMTVDQDNPPLPFPDPDELAKKNNYQNQDWQDLIHNWHSERNAHLAYLRQRPESDWERPAQHPTRGLFTLHDQLFLANRHDALHLEQITKILAEKKA